MTKKRHILIDENKYIRNTETDRAVAIVSLFNPKTNTNVHLVSATHIATQEFYAQVSNRLNGYDLTLYELVKGKAKGKEKSLSERLSYFGNERKRDTVRDFAEVMNSKLEKNVDKEIQNLKNSFPDNADKFEKYRALWILEGQITTQHDIDYNSLPDNWLRADANYDEIIDAIGLLSTENLKGWISNIYLSKDSNYEQALEQAADDLIENGIEMKNMNDSSNGRRDRFRESKIYKQLSRAEKNPHNKNIGIFYGVAHMPFIERELLSQGYEFKDIEYITNINYKPSTIARDIPGIENVVLKTIID